ncbi:MAG: hypothetical protein ACOCP8_06195, partial [archaeon]
MNFKKKKILIVVIVLVNLFLIVGLENSYSTNVNVVENKSQDISFLVENISEKVINYDYCINSDYNYNFSNNIERIGENYKITLNEELKKGYNNIELIVRDNKKNVYEKNSTFFVVKPPKLLKPSYNYEVISSDITLEWENQPVENYVLKVGEEEYTVEKNRKTIDVSNFSEEEKIEWSVKSNYGDNIQSKFSEFNAFFVREKENYDPITPKIDILSPSTDNTTIFRTKNVKIISEIIIDENIYPKKILLELNGDNENISKNLSYKINEGGGVLRDNFDLSIGEYNLKIIVIDDFGQEIIEEKNFRIEKENVEIKPRIIFPDNEVNSKELSLVWSLKGFDNQDIMNNNLKPYDYVNEYDKYMINDYYTFENKEKYFSGDKELWRKV